jgi:RNA polymerase-binding transcription factor DksA
MAIKKKAVKPVKKAPSKPAAKAGKQATAKKSAGPKKPAPKPSAKPAKPVAAKKDMKPVQKKVIKPVAAAKPLVKPAKPAATAPASKPVAKPPATAGPAPAAKPAAVTPAEKPAIQQPAVPQVKSLVSTPPPPPRPVAKKEQAKPTKVVIPEMKTKSSVKYQPEFTKSVLDTPQQHIQTGPTMRYSDAELGEFREIIMKKLEAAKKELTYLQGLITRKDEMGGDESENRYMTMEDGSMSMEREQLSQMASRQITFIDHLEKALMRIENKTYGICRVTGKLIDKARLRAVPHATLSIEAKQTMNK